MKIVNIHYCYQTAVIEEGTLIHLLEWAKGLYRVHYLSPDKKIFWQREFDSLRKAEEHFDKCVEVRRTIEKLHKLNI